MRVKVLAEEQFRVLATMQGDVCPAEEFLVAGEAQTRASRIGLLTMLQHVAASGLRQLPAAWVHEANKEHGIYEFIKGPLRLFFFEGVGGAIAICTSGARKTGRKADKQAVAKAIESKKAYFAAVQLQTLEVIEDEDQ